jgi:multidrug efflux pump subunit AcrA (membrane-fusion protein)
VILIGACGEKPESSRRGGATATSQPVIAVEVETVTPRALAHRIPIVGTLFAAEEAVISSKSAGVLRQTFVDVGSRVRPGDPLLQVDRVDYEMAVRQAEASLAEALSRLGVDAVPTAAFDLTQVSTVQRAAAQLENARLTYERLTNLGTVVSSQELNDATARLRVAEADHQLSLDEARALIATARARHSAVELARQKLDETLTRTPPIPTTLGKEGAGEWIVAARLVTEGQYLGVASNAYRLIINNPLKLRSKVPERYAPEVSAEQAVQLEGRGGMPGARGKIVRISPAVEPASRTFEIEALIDNNDNALKSGTFAKGLILVEGSTRVFSVPAGAIVTTGGATQVFAVENGTARRRVVQTGRAAEGRIEIVSGLREGEQVITQPPPALADGAAVRVR